MRTLHLENIAKSTLKQGPAWQPRQENPFKYPVSNLIPYILYWISSQPAEEVSKSTYNVFLFYLEKNKHYSSFSKNNLTKKALEHLRNLRFKKIHMNSSHIWDLFIYKTMEVLKIQYIQYVNGIQNLIVRKGT
jgi:hypothetical protein